jgi:guanylate kinase
MTELPSYTTRPKRYPEEEGHLFVSKADFDKLGNRVAYVEYDGFEYCATAEQLMVSDLLTIDPQGLLYYRKHCPKSVKYYIVYITVNSNERRHRMLSRGDPLDKVNKRLYYDNELFKGFDKVADIVIENNDYSETLSKVLSFIRYTNREQCI